MRLNQFIAQAGICSRRKADRLISEGKINVNGLACRALGFQVQRGDQVTYKGQRLLAEVKTTLLLHKPTNCLTTLSDPQGRRTVLDLLPSIKQRIYPIGRLDRNSSGLLLLTNEGLLAKALAHPSSEVSKVYEVGFKMVLPKGILCQLTKNGVKLEDGKCIVDDAAWIGGERKQLLLTLHSGKNRIIRRLFETLGFPLSSLKRVGYGGLMLGKCRPGYWRWLTAQEVGQLYQQTKQKKSADIQREQVGI